MPAPARLAPEAPLPSRRSSRAMSWARAPDRRRARHQPCPRGTARSRAALGRRPGTRPPPRAPSSAMQTRVSLGSPHHIGACLPRASTGEFLDRDSEEQEQEHCDCESDHIVLHSRCAVDERTPLGDAAYASDGTNSRREGDEMPWRAERAPSHRLVCVAPRSPLGASRRTGVDPTDRATSLQRGQGDNKDGPFARLEISDLPAAALDHRGGIHGVRAHRHGGGLGTDPNPAAVDARRGEADRNGSALKRRPGTCRVGSKQQGGPGSWTLPRCAASIYVQIICACPTALASARASRPPSLVQRAGEQRRAHHDCTLMMLGLLTLTCGTAWAQVYRNARSAVLRNEDRPNRHFTSYANEAPGVARWEAPGEAGKISQMREVLGPTAPSSG